MTALISLFTDAFMAEQKRWTDVLPLCRVQFSGHRWYTNHVETADEFTGTRADCERFVVDRCLAKFVEALAERAGYDDEDVKQWLLMVLNGEIKPIATELETSGDVG